jgi:hypothetical protein
VAESEGIDSGRLPAVVYHYTSIDTMLKIVENNCIWATSINYLNDTTEAEHYTGLIRRHIGDYVLSHKDTNPQIFDRILNEPRRSFEDRPYVASFSGMDDHLPQWRSYCPQGNGVAIGFGTDCLLHSRVKDAALQQEPPHPEKWRFEFFRPKVSFAKIEYLDSSAEEMLDRDISDAIQEVEAGVAELAGNTSDPHEKEPPNSPARLFEAAIQKRASFKKNPSFSNEHEYRLLVRSSIWNRRLLEFRTTRSTLVPYLPVDIPRVNLKPQPWPHENSLTEFIARVVVGPTPNRELSHQAISSFLFKSGLKKVEVKQSGIPYRDW